MGDPPPLIRGPASTSNLELLRTPPPEPLSHPTPSQCALSQQQQSRISSASAAFHKRKSKETNKSSVNSGEADRQQEEAYDNEDNNTNRGGHQEGVVVTPGLLLDHKKAHLLPQWSLKERLNSLQHQRDIDTVPPADTIRKRIKFIMGDDDDDDEVAVGAENVDQENFMQPQARKSNCKKLSPAPSSSSAAPQLTSKLRLRTSCSRLNMDSETTSLLLLHHPEHHQKKKWERNPSSAGSAGQKTRNSLSEEQQHKKPKQRKKTARSAPATTNRGTNNSSTSSNRTRSRFFSRFNKRTVRAVVLLVVKLCGLLVASILIPSSKQLVTAVNSGFDSDQQQQFDQPSAATNLDDMLAFDEYGNAISPLDGYGSSTISPANNVSANVTHKDPLFPEDLFTLEQRRNGAVIFHIIGVMYMFVALAIVCDEFFVPSLDVIIEKMGITDDVAGATFMAAGGSAPELFTSVIGVFVSFDDVGIGTIVGSAVFNILFVIGMCALFSKTILSLTWWPLFRDCTFYSVSLLILIYFFRDNQIYWWEALILFSIYVAYVSFMKWNVQMERFVKKLIYKNKVTRVRSTDQLMPAGNAANSSETSMATQPGGSVTSRAASESRSGPSGHGGAGSSGHVTGAKFRHGLLQLMIHTIDPLHDDDVLGKVDEKATQLHAIASLKVLLDATKPQRGAASTSAANHVKINLRETNLTSDRPNGNIDTQLDNGNDDIEDEPEPLNMAWPSTNKKRITYLLVAPILFPLWLTLPDTKTPRGKKFYPVTFLGSIVWIAAYSYLMVWWANVAGETANIAPEVMGLTFLAAGTSIPDLITSVIVARKGFGDMAVSSSVGSNIFDVTVGLPIPWLLYGLIYGQPVEVSSSGMVCSITILFMMLLFVVLSIACFNWRMNKGLGLTMFLLYFVFVAVSLLFEYDVLECPV